MKNAVVYYSLTGNTDLTAKKISEALGAKLSQGSEIDVSQICSARMYKKCGYYCQDPRDAKDSVRFLSGFK